MQLVVGRVGRAHGIRGEVSVLVRTDDPGRRFAPGSVLATDPAALGPLTVGSVRWHLGRLLVRFDGLADRTQAEGLAGALLLVDSANVGTPDDPDEFNDHDLIGLAAVTVAGERVGTVTDVLHHGQDLLVITSGAGGATGAGGAAGAGGETLVPFVRSIVPEVDLAAGRLVLDPPPGLLDPGEAI
jgi:16S rRNA processing protein RimM